MKKCTLARFCFLAVSALLASAPAVADKPDWAGGGKEGKHARKHDDRDSGSKKSHKNHDRDSATLQIRFGDGDRRVVQEYFGNQGRSGHCPPGLAKKNNGCLPPGQAKKWSRGAPLPRDLQYYDLPRDLLIRLPIPPSGQRYVRIAGDILLIAIGTNMVLDAIEDLGR
ncbi:MAG TPA: RcnB family protein [Rhodocyclaceae bacterium]|nr:RcnB family protein [Rhodocyclaceae bacterium]